MKIIASIISVILFVLGVILIILDPLSPVMISTGMFLIAIAILSVALQIYYPEKPKHVELRVIETKRPKRVYKPKKKRPRRITTKRRTRRRR